MKTAVCRLNLAATQRHSWQGLTLVEMMTTMGVFSIVVMALIYSHIFGLRQDHLVESKLGASDQARKGFDKIARDIRSAKVCKVGTGDASGFTPVADDEPKRAGALEVYPIARNTNNFVRYYFATASGTNHQLLRMESPNGSAPTVIASHLMEPLEFTIENHKGVVQTDAHPRHLVHFTLRFREYQYPLTKIGYGQLYDFYKMEFMLTPYAPE